MSIRNVVFGMAVLSALSAWAWCRPCGNDVHAQGAQAAVTAEEPTAGGNKDEAVARFRCNGSRHWKQVVVSR